MPVSSYIPIQGTSLIVVPYYVPVDGAPPPAPPPDVGLLEGLMIGALAKSTQAVVSWVLKTPLDVLFDTGWANERASATAKVEQGIADAIHGASLPRATSISVSLPQRGSLAAQSNTLAAGAPIRTLFPATIPADAPADFVDLLYSLPSPSATINWFDFVTFELSFDGAIELVVIVPHNPSYPLYMTAMLQATNLNLSPTDFGGYLASAAASIASFFIGQPLTNAFHPADQEIPVAVSSLLPDVAKIVDAFTTVPVYGFVELSVRVNESPPPTAFLGGPETGATVEFDLTHPFDPPPVVANAWGDAGTRFALAVLQLATSAVAAGDQLGVSGSGFPPGQATQLEVTWSDTCSGTVSLSELQWGENLGLISPPVVPNPEEVVIKRNKDDGLNRYTASGLAPSTVYAFRVRDYDANFVATQWSDWKAITTQATEELELILSYEDFETTPLGTVQLAPADGAFSTTVTIPTGLQPGTYIVQAVLADVVLAQASLSVGAAGEPVPPSIVIYDPNTGLPASGVVTVFGNPSLYLRGHGFTPGGQVELYVDTAQGISLATWPVRAWPRGSFLATVPWPAVTDGPHQILAMQATLTATASVWSSGTAE